jgi:hypothetical protein
MSNNKNNDETIDEIIKKILNQTNYTEEIARKKLEEFNNDFMKVLKDYMGISEKKENNAVKSINQEIYRQIRHNLDSSMAEYRNKNPLDINQATQNLMESEERLKNKG